MTTEEAKSLLQMEKIYKDKPFDSFIDENPYRLKFSLASLDNLHLFRVKVYRKNRIRFKMNYVNLYQDNTILVRIDIGEKLVHRNPDGTLIRGNHVHYHDEEYGDKFAETLPSGIITDYDNIETSINDFMRLINVVEKPIINYKESDKKKQMRLF